MAATKTSFKGKTQNFSKFNPMNSDGFKEEYEKESEKSEKRKKLDFSTFNKTLPFFDGK